MTATNHPDPTPPPAEPAPSLRPVEELVPRNVEEIAALVRRVHALPAAAAELVAREFVGDRLAAADRENAELRETAADWERQADEHYADLVSARSENVDLRAAILRNVDTHADLSTQLAAAQAQLAEACAVLHEFVNVRGDFYEPRPLAAMIERLSPSLGFALRSDWRTFVSREREGAGGEARLEAVRALAERLRLMPSARLPIDAVLQDHDEWVADQLVAALSAAPQPEPDGKERQAMEADAMREPSPSAMLAGIHVTPYRPQDCACRGKHGHRYGYTEDCTVRDCTCDGGPTNPECRHCNGSGNAHTFAGDDVGICGTCHGTGSAAGGGL